jgi:hypothetical protein
MRWKNETALAARTLQRGLAADRWNRPSQPTTAGPRNNGTRPDTRPTASLTTQGRSGSRSEIGGCPGIDAAVCPGVEALLRHREKPFRRAVRSAKPSTSCAATPRRPSVTPVEDPCGRWGKMTIIRETAARVHHCQPQSDLATPTDMTAPPRLYGRGLMEVRLRAHVFRSAQKPSIHYLGLLYVRVDHFLRVSGRRLPRWARDRFGSIGK